MEFNFDLSSLLKNAKKLEGYDNIFLLNGHDTPPTRFGSKNLSNVIDQMGR